MIEKEIDVVPVDPVIVRSGAGRLKELRYGRGSMEVLVDSSDGASHIDVHVNAIHPDTSPGPRHYHSGNENAYFVLSGEGLIGVGREEYTVGTGVISSSSRRGFPISFTTRPADQLRLIEIYAPATVDFVEVRPL